MSRSRVVFFLIIGVAILVVIGAGLFQSLQRDQQAAGATSVAQATLTAVGLPGNTGANIVPIFAGGQPPTDPLPKYVCEISNWLCEIDRVGHCAYCPRQ